MVLAHRYAYIITGHALGDDEFLRHLVCDNPPCCNPAHLRPGTKGDNAQDMVRAGRHVAVHFVGTANPMAKLTPADVVSIREESAHGDTQKAIAERHGVSRSLVGAIVHRVLWRDVGAGDILGPVGAGGIDSGTAIGGGTTGV